MSLTGTAKCDVCGNTAPAISQSPWLTYPTGWIQLTPNQWAHQAQCAQQYYSQVASQPAAPAQTGAV